MSSTKKPNPAYRILNAEPSGYSAEAHALLSQVGIPVEKEMTRAELLQELPKYDVLIVRLGHQVDREVIEAGLNLKAIVSATTGLDHIDVESAQARSISVLSLKGETDYLRDIRATAEHTWALLLGLLRRLVPAALAARSGNWNRDAFRGRELQDQDIGIVGLGRIGKMIVRYGQVFGMGVGAFDPYTREWTDGVWQASTLEQLLASSTVLTLHVPLNNETRGMIGPTELQQLPRGAVLINTSRGQLIDETALVKSLENGHLAGAALDVIADERNSDRLQKSPLLDYAKKFDNLLITPHIGGATYESMAKTEIFMARKLTEFIRNLNKN
ncbi:MAG: NAD(P)-dependent oxidoreductase [Desulfobacterales bacterium]|jgi:D-3-phosphoglycerate dehydrogenase